MAVDISKVLKKEMTFLDVPAFEDKNACFTFMSEKFQENGIVSDAKAFEASLHAREEEGPTYMGNLLAMPHGICDEVITPGVGFCRVAEPFTYKSNDEEGPVKYIFTLAIAKVGKDGEDGRMAHLYILAALARLLAHEEFLEKLGTVQSYEEIIQAIEDIQNAEE